LRGFSLIELVMVVCILAIMSAVAVPRFARSRVRYRVDAAALRVAADLNLARQRAGQISASQTVSFDVAAGTYSLSGLADMDHPTTTYTVRLGDPPYEVQMTSADFGGDAQLILDGWGVPDSGGTVVLRATDCVKTITVAPGTGQVTITESVLPEVQAQVVAH
jgi:prepilin-type N-terminal cleavage/methylation domain-containing protein